MANTKFLDPGGDANFNAGDTTGNGGYGFWGSRVGSPDIATDFVHGTHVKSIKFRTANDDEVRTPAGVLADAGFRVSIWKYFNAFQAGSQGFFFDVETTGFAGTVFKLGCTSAGVLKVYDSGVTILGSGPTLVTGKWYRFSVRYTATSVTVNRIEIQVFDSDGTTQLASGSISITNATLQSVSASGLSIGNYSSVALDLRISDIYIDDSNALTDPGNIWVTAKRPNANGTLNEWTTQIGSGGSGYGTGHSPQVNERPSSATNGWSFKNVAKKVEEYSIEGKAVGDLSVGTVVDFMGWVDCLVDVASTANIILAGVATNISVLVLRKIFTKFAGSTTYPAGNTDIGMDNNTVNNLFSLYECGVVVAYIPSNAWTQTLTETVVDTDTLIKAPNRTLSETITDTATFASVHTWGKTFSETLAMVDTFLRTITHVMTETLAMVATSLKQAMRIFTETITDTDTFTGLRVLPRTLTETLSMLDANIGRVITHVMTETLAMVASINSVINRVYSEVMSLTDTVAYVHTIFGTFMETISTTDLIARLEQRILTEVISLTATFAYVRIKLLTETLAMVDTVARLTIRVFTEIVSILDTIPRLVSRTLTDTISTTATFIRFGQRILTETVSTTDTVLKTATHVLTETLHLADQLIVRLNGIVTNLWAKVARTIDAWTKQSRN